MGARVVANGISQKAYEDGYSVSKSSIDNYLKGGMPMMKEYMVRLLTF